MPSTSIRFWPAGVEEFPVFEGVEAIDGEFTPFSRVATESAVGVGLEPRLFISDAGDAVSIVQTANHTAINIKIG
jgi:hypothetical protein